MREEYELYIPDCLRRFGPQWVIWNPENHIKGHMDNLNNFFQKRASMFLSIVEMALELEEPVGITVRSENPAKGKVYINGRSVALEDNARIVVFAQCGLTVSAVPAEGAVFKGWEVTGGSVELQDPEAATTAITFDSEFTLTAVFE